MHHFGTPSQGDTQPASQWVYDYCTSKSEADELGISQLNGHRYSQNVTENAIDTGHIDLLAGFDQPSITDATGDSILVGLDDDIDPLSQDIRADIFPESKRFRLPKTPASQGIKRKRSSEGPPDITRTPSLPENPFAEGTEHQEMLRPSQLFKATQAITSPLNTILDLGSDRPSPDLHSDRRPSTTGTQSSPARLRRSNMVRAVTEPQTTYVSMKESQEARERRLQAMEENLPDNLSDDEFDSVGSQLRKKFNRKQIDEAARTQFAGVAARSQPLSGGRVRRRRLERSIDQTHNNPLQIGRQANQAVLISDDTPPEEVRENSTEEETEREDVTEDKTIDDVDELAEENKENIEVPMTVSRLYQATLVPTISQQTPSHHPPQRSARVSRAYQATLNTSSPVVSRSPERVTTSQSGSQIHAVVDSQSSQQPRTAHHRTHRQRHHDIPPSSLDSRVMVPHSQASQIPNSSIGANRADREQDSAEETRQSQKRLNNAEQGHTETVADNESAHQETNPFNAFGSATDSQIQPKAINNDLNEVRHDAKACPSSAELNRNADINRRITPVPTQPSASMPSPRSTPKSTFKEGSNHNAGAPSGPSTLFETAKEHIASPPFKSRVQSLHHAPLSKTSSPAKSQSQALRTMQQIAEDASPPDSFGDIDVGSILSKNDLEDQILIQGSSPHLPTSETRRARNRPSQSIPLRQQPSGETPPRPPSWAYSPLTSQQEQLASDIEIGPAYVSAKEKFPVEESSKAADKVVRAPSAHDLALPMSKSPKSGIAPSLSFKTSRTIRADHAVLGGSTAAPCIDTSIAVGNRKRPGIVAPNRVFAYFNGSNPGFYTATCTNMIPEDEPRYQVTFDDGAKDTINGFGIKRLELWPGDVCKVDMEGFRSKSFVVVNLQYPYQSANPDLPSRKARSDLITTDNETDIFGHTHVNVSPKRRGSTSSEHEEGKELVVPLSQVYLTHTLWSSIRNREYYLVLDNQPALTGLQTPSERPSTPSTPFSRARRAKSSTLPPSRLDKNVSDGSEGLFDNMVFTLTNIAHSDHLKRMRSLIEANGGRVLESGFDELFHVPHLSRTVSPSKNKAGCFQLTSPSKNIGFVCLIADRHCRRAKYIQALALGIPCLATRWITDCVTKATLLPLSPYVLPAGESTFLDGAIRSRVLDPLPNPRTSTLSGIVSQRPNMLANTSILLIMQRHEEKIMKHHNFLTHALGATRVSRVMSIEIAARAVREALANGEQWDWVYTHDKEKETEKAIFGASGTKRRKQALEGELGRTRVVGNEFVIQSLILGQLAET